MDKLALSGLLLALLAIVGGFAIEGGGIGALFHFPAFLIVVGGSLGAVMLQTPSMYFIQGLKMSVNVWKYKSYDFQQQKQLICSWAEVTRQHGFLILENQVQEQTESFTKRALTMLVDGVEKDVLQNALELDISLDSEKKLKSARIYEALGGYAPTIGIIGAVLGLIHAMTSINDPNVLGQGIATAFVATIYGVGMANLVFIPMAKKLYYQIEQEILFREMILEGVLSVADGENPHNIARKLDAYSYLNS